jgi:NADH-quinone oxidoreductase subunit C
MQPDELIAALDKSPAKPVEAVNKFGTVFVTVKPEDMPRFAKYLRDTAELGFDLLEYAYGTDWMEKEQMEVGYHLTSTKHQHDLVFRCYIPRSEPKLATLTGIWRAADLHEREVYDLLGVEFTGHPDLRRLLTPPEFEGFPLRRDYASPNFEPLPKK